MESCAYLHYRRCCMYMALIAAAGVLVLLLWLVCVAIAFRQRRLYTIARGVVLAPSLLSSALEQFTTERSNAWCTLFILSATLHCSALLCYYCCLCQAAGRLYRRTLYARLETFSLMSISQSDSPNSHRMTNGVTNKFNSTVKERRRGSR